MEGVRVAGAGARAVAAHLAVGNWQCGSSANQPRIGYAKIKAIACPISTSPG